MGGIDQVIELARKGELVPEPDLRRLCDYIKELLLEESNVQPVSSPVTICGDIHGQFYDLLELFKVGGDIPDSKYIFMGDYVDRGFHGVESFTLLMAMKAKYPDRITLLRGNHESRGITQMYGFYNECQEKYGSAAPWKYFMEVFDYLTIAALIDGEVLCLHGGISPDAKTLDQIRTIVRNQEIPHEGAFADIMWSDPDEEVETFAPGPRGAGWLFGARVMNEFSRINNLSLTCRAHQLVMEGYAYSFPDKNLVTVWSAPNYVYRCGNVASVLSLDEHLNREWKIFNAVSSDGRGSPKKSLATSMYFM